MVCPSYTGSTVQLLNCIALKLASAWKVSQYIVISGPYFPVFGQEKTPYLETFHAVGFGFKFALTTSNMQYLATICWYWLCNIIVFIKLNPFTGDYFGVTYFSLILKTTQRSESL